MQTTVHKIYSPATSDKALARTHMEAMAYSVESALNNLDDKVIGREGVLSQRDDSLAAKDAELEKSIATVSSQSEDTGWRDIPLEGAIAPLIDTDVANATNKKRSFVEIRRIGSFVALRGYVKLTAEQTQPMRIVTIPNGFNARVIDDSAFNAAATNSGSYGSTFRTAVVQYTPWTKNVFGNAVNSVEWVDGFGFYLTWVADDAFPAVLPGTAVTQPYSPVANGSALSLAQVKSQLDNEVTRSTNADTTIGTRVTNAEARISSIEGTLTSVPKYYIGTGFPEGKVTAPVGSIYTDTAKTAGAWQWRKTSGTGNTGWSILHGDTGWRAVNVGSISSGTLNFRRVDNQVYVHAGSGNYRTMTLASLGVFNVGVNMFTPTQTEFISVRSDSTKQERGVLSLEYTGVVVLKMFSGSVESGSFQTSTQSYVTDRGWDSSLPGTAITI